MRLEPPADKTADKNGVPARPAPHCPSCLPSEPSFRYRGPFVAEHHELSMIMSLSLRVRGFEVKFHTWVTRLARAQREILIGVIVPETRQQRRV